jgi:predicted Zn-dependent peptidase
MSEKTVLPNGVRVITEEIGYVRSVSIGAWVASGSRYEEDSIGGVAHFIEHMLFKGTTNRTAFEIASAIDSVGGVLNAYTGKELTSFYAKVPDYYALEALDLLSDLLRNALFDPLELEKEKFVVLQEIKMVEDTPDDAIHDFFELHFWKNHPLRRAVLGSRESVEALDRDGVIDFFSKRYHGRNLVIAAAGNVKHGPFVEQVERLLQLPAAEEGPGAGKVPPPEATAGLFLQEKDLEQVHVLMGSLGPHAADEDRYPAMLVNIVLGGSMSSRLFQEIREKRGLVYSIHSFLVPYSDTGWFGIHFGTEGDRVREVAGLVSAELRKLCRESLTAEEIRSGKEQMKGSFLLSMESTDVRMSRLARNEMTFGRQVPVEEVLRKIDGITEEDIRRVAGWMLRPEALSMAVLGRVPGGVTRECLNG